MTCLFFLFLFFFGVGGGGGVGTDLQVWPAPASQPPCRRRHGGAARVYVVGKVDRIC